MNKKTKRNAFTLVELMVVISVIGLISAVVLVSLNSARLKAYDARRNADINQISKALALIYDRDGKFPCHSIESSYNNSDFMSFLVTSGYMAKAPVDPQNDAVYHYDYMTLKKTASGRCGQIAFMGIYTNNRAICPLSGHSHSSGTHCHIFFPEPPPAPCDTLYYKEWPEACPLRDVVDEY